MKFDRQKLMDAADSALDEIENEADREYRRELEKVSAAEAEWREKHARDWRDAAFKIVELLDAGQVVVANDLPRNCRYGQTALFYRSTVRRANTEFAAADLKAFRRALEAMTEDEVSSHALEKLGLLKGFRAAWRHLPKPEKK